MIMKLEMKRHLQHTSTIITNKLFKSLSPIKEGRIAHLAVYHKDHLVRKKNMKRILKYLNIKDERRLKTKWKS